MSLITYITSQQVTGWLKGVWSADVASFPGSPEREMSPHGLVPSPSSPHVRDCSFRFSGEGSGDETRTFMLAAKEKLIINELGLHKQCYTQWRSQDIAVARAQHSLYELPREVQKLI